MSQFTEIHGSQMCLAGVNMYKVKTTLAQLVENDPLYECKDYDENNSYNHCINKELEVDK